ncbi:MAG: phosphate regulon sensor histidine kinase PhoR [Clostridia bacterium]|nr:phosphate regulon sensor histidine kinase PhoR [Clostridia bacterium]
MFKRLHWRLTFLYLSLFLIASLVAGNYLLLSLQNFLVINREQHLTMDARAVGEVITPLVEKDDRESLDDKVKRLGKNLGVRITVIGPNGTVWGDSDLNPRTMENHLSRPEVVQALKGQTGTSVRYSNSVKQKMMYAAIPLYTGEQITAVVRLSLPISDVEKSLDEIKLMMAVTVAIILAISALLAFWVARRFTKPIRELAHMVEGIAQGDFERRVGNAGSTEVDGIVQTISQVAWHLKDNLSEISREKNKMKAILASLVEGVVATDREGRIILFNRAAERMFALKEEAVTGKYILEAIRNLEIETYTQEVLRFGQSLTNEDRIFPGGDQVFKIHISPIRTIDGWVMGAVLVFRDVTELRTLEQMRTEFVANVSHELRTPLTSIKGFVETLLDGAMEQPHVARRFLEIINEETDRLYRLITDLLSLAHLESPRAELPGETISLNKVLDKAIAVLEPLARGKDIAINLKLETHPIRVRIGEDLLGQVLMNLLDNAIKYTPAGGLVMVSATRLSEVVEVKVSDTGIGIPPESLPRLFERFYRVDKARSREMGGTGLGLSIIKHILERYGQKITVQSQLGQGTTFTFTLPLE